MDKLVKYSFIKVDTTTFELQVENNEHSKEYLKQIKDPKTCAYVMENVTEDRIYTFIKYRSGFLYDVFRSDDKGYTTMEWKYKKVNTNVFFTYLKYIGALKTFKKFKGKKFLLSQAENLIN